MADPQPAPSLSLRQIVFGAVAVAGLAAVGYAVWFDNRRRNDANFRKKLRGSPHGAATHRREI